jgi:GNAT superfamily N-acetyltransferase
MTNLYRIIEVNSKSSRDQFIKLPAKLYRNDPNWIRPLNKDIEEVFDPSKNKSFRHGDCQRWILVDQTGNTVGRVAAFYDKKTAHNNDQPTGGMGFFECVNQVEAAHALFDTCKEWLAGKGLEAMDGPVNFGDRDRWWGLLVDGFYPANYCMPYNPPYYQELFESYGFRNYFNQYTYHRYINKDGLHHEILEKAERIARNPSYVIRTLDKRQTEKFSSDFCTIYNKGWARFTGVKPITQAHARGLFKSIKPIMDEDLLWFAYHDGEPVAFFLMLPEINQIVRHLNGKFDTLAKLKFLYHKWKKTCTKAFGVIFGIVPEHQGKGLEGALVMAFAGVAWKPGFQYKELELNWIGDFNPSMMKVAEQIGASIRKTHVTYRYLFDPTREFKRAPFVNKPSRS